MEIGCCGFGISQSEYFARFDAIEIQQTFYQPPRISTLQGWRLKAPKSFHFSIKAWQLITHAHNSSTYRRLKRPLSDAEKLECGSFQSSKLVKEAWQVTLDCAEALQATAILFQCPGSFVPTKQNIEQMTKFFSAIERPKGKVTFAWEPRGDWKPTIIKRLCSQLDLVHATDPFALPSVTNNIYFRLHGRTGWRYEYTGEELKKLSSMTDGDTDARVFFNNVSMVDDATRFQNLVQSDG